MPARLKSKGKNADITLNAFIVVWWYRGLCNSGTGTVCRLWVEEAIRTPGLEGT